MFIKTDSFFCMQCKIVHIRRKGDLIMTTGWIYISRVQHAVGFCSACKPQSHRTAHESLYAKVT